MTFDLNTPFVDRDGETVCLADYPPAYIAALFAEEYCYEEVKQRLLDWDEVPGCCPIDRIDPRGQVFVNGTPADCHHMGECDGSFDIHEDASQFAAEDVGDVSFRYHWLRDNCKGAWIITSDQHVKSWDLPWDVYVTFLDPDDEALYLKHFG